MQVFILQASVEIFKNLSLHDVKDITFKERLLFQYIKIKKPLSKLEKQGQQAVLK